MKKAIIIGATSGIGRELAKLFVKDGFTVGVTGRRQALLDTLQKEFPGNIITEQFDVTGSENIVHVDDLIHKLGGLDILIYNSGYGDPSEDLVWETDKQTTLTNVNGFIEIVNHIYNYFLKQGYGQIAGISSIASVRGNSFAPAYSASKAFMSTYLEGLYIKGSKKNISITDIQPGFVKTKMAKGHGQFWVSSVEKASEQIYKAIKRKKRRVYITRRWWIIAKLMKFTPFGILKKFM